MVMSYTEMTNYIRREVGALGQRLSAEGMDLDLLYATMLDQAAYGYANMEGAEGMSDVFRQTADEMDAGDYKHRTVVEGRPTFRVIEGGGPSKV